MLLFADEAPESGLGTDPTGDAFGYSKVVDAFKVAMKDAIDPSRYQSFFIKLEDQAKKSGRSLAGSIQGYSDALQESMFNVYKQTVSIGGSTKDVIDFAEQYAATTGRVPPILEESVVEAVKLSKEFGISTKEIAAMTGEFAKLGLTQSKAIDMMKRIGETARKNMVNAASLTKVVQENVKKTASYTFKDGIQGLTKMAAQAERLGVKLDSSFKLFDEFMDPDKAIEFASEMQMLGGEFASQFGDPFSNMGASVEELREKITKSASSFAEFDKKTGEFKVSREGLKALRILSEKTGESMDDLASVATQAAKESRILNEVGFKPEVDEEDRKLLASMAEQKGGEWKVQLPGTKEWLAVSEVNAKNMEDFQKASQFKEKSVEEVNKSMLSIAEQQNATLQQIRDAVILQGGLGAGQDAAKIAKTINDALGTAAEKIANLYPASKMKEIINDVEIKLSNYINTDLESHLNKIITKFDKFADELTTFMIPTEDGFFPGSGSAPKIMSEGKIYEGIVGDQVAVGTNLDSAFEMSKEQFNTMKVLADTFGVSVDDLKDPFKMIGAANKSNPTLQSTLGEKPTRLSEVMTNNTTNTNINTTNTQNLSGGFTISIDASKVPNSLDPTMLKNEMMKVMYQLSDEMKKQGVLNFKLK
jgi:hypothetical protein